MFGFIARRIELEHIRLIVHNYVSYIALMQAAELQGHFALYDEFEDINERAFSDFLVMQNKKIRDPSVFDNLFSDNKIVRRIYDQYRLHRAEPFDKVFTPDMKCDELHELMHGFVRDGGPRFD